MVNTEEALSPSVRQNTHAECTVLQYCGSEYYWRYKLTDLLRHTYLTHTMCFINDKTRQELPLIQILQSGNQPVTCTDLDQRQGRVLNAHLNDTVTTIQSLPIKLALIYEENRSKQQRGHFSMLAHIQQFYLQVSGSNFCLPQRI